MRKARHIDISSRLEATKQFGLVEDYRIEWREKSLCPPRVTIRSRSTFPVQVTRNYVASLIGHLVPTRDIVVTRDQ
jgi:hypothetical protein